MALGIGVLITERMSAALVSDNSILGQIQVRPNEDSYEDTLHSVPVDSLVRWIAEMVDDLSIGSSGGEQPTFLGVGIPGIVRNGVVEDSPNLVQFKGANMQAMISEVLSRKFPNIRVSIFNDADVMAAGIAAGHGHLDRLIRVWTLGTGIGYGRYPFSDGVWEAGHSVVTLDPKEQFCACGGKGHLEGIMGQRAMRLRFMDMEPEEIFQYAAEGEARCVEFVKVWHRALAAGTATSIHLDGPGKFFVTGFNARFLNVVLLNEYLHEMVKLSPLQGYQIEVVPGGETVAVIGAAVNAAQAAERC
jgi:glucokinase